jgi:uncharacterized glyoxalase superfamily protein PhnB
MPNLNTVELKAFVPARDYERSKAFYQDVGFTLASDWDGEVAYFHHGEVSFLLQNFYREELANNFMMHLLVEDVDAWHVNLVGKKIAETHGTKIGELKNQPWGIREFALWDPSGVLWMIGRNID